MWKGLSRARSRNEHLNRLRCLRTKTPQGSFNIWYAHIWSNEWKPQVTHCLRPLSRLLLYRSVAWDFKWTCISEEVFTILRLMLDLQHQCQCTSTARLLSAPVLFPSMEVFLSYKHASIQFSHWPDFDDSISWVFKCTAFCRYWALNNAVCWKSMHRSDGLSGRSEAVVLVSEWVRGDRGLIFFLSHFVQHSHAEWKAALRAAPETLPALKSFTSLHSSP